MDFKGSIMLSKNIKKCNPARLHLRGYRQLRYTISMVFHIQSVVFVSSLWSQSFMVYWCDKMHLPQRAIYQKKVNVFLLSY